ncbi:MAG: tetratricopeptide repeat protein, partial [Planctomycetaceae bacterium]|nr:tetratricopeptide repeat protein [Planctomycetaceae bacterium]
RHAEFADRLNQLAAVLAGSERLDEAASLLDEVTQIYEQLGGADPARTAEVIRKRADLMRRLQRADESVRLERLAESLQGRSSHVLEDIL